MTDALIRAGQGLVESVGHLHTCAFVRENRACTCFCANRIAAARDAWQKEVQKWYFNWEKEGEL